MPKCERAFDRKALLFVRPRSGRRGVNREGFYAAPVINDPLSKRRFNMLRLCLGLMPPHSLVEGIGGLPDVSHPAITKHPQAINSEARRRGAHAANPSGARKPFGTVTP